ncbi:MULTISPECIES: L-serine ammonia-lyase [unclassified Clostridioides]|uniref:L-serine ammonia-lyase n=1 Tax=unclassified Clostridioides TaxID=2635829 RepID=UPI001D0C2635|nr:L-serine ammonia-lyase [Clostridioides sp. ZZV15-6388]MCC0634713.1 L-serine ammonia-lyase [Clostridioides sp. ES-S-0001-02]MCC0641533.1 L-serine ammonia-lyase [Clostridioides sp. ES-S-0049-03]MCC0645577.1 L-serine ammonia-lyase [Clostridioides sp. ZZV14-6150]MCC0651108.1 L-serine ammonia-lyase [Clostridioides sp. ES-S-0001-03]MCC0656128.1 L-serine ammonia-lyase [Clostridioides sp. ES-S-0123-01]MCC0663990.1 L-serine ammonia-lyase [Clostridioides sp. ZZV15-6597]MCC0669586.1 L-serine ammonia
MDTLKELFKIGSGPSSSHTMGPQRAAERFKNENPDAESFRAILYGSLAATGKGHLTDYIIEKTIAPKKVEIVWEEDIIKDFHPNGMKFEALDKDGNVTAEWTVYSVGGGTIAEEGQRNSKSNSIYHLDTMDEIVKWCKENNKTLVDFVLECEPSDIKDYIKTIKDAMRKSIDDGLSTDEVIPGKLLLKRRANNFYKAYQEDKSFSTLVYAYALAASEQNASGNIIVTAPTCGSAGVIPGIFFAMQDFYKYDDEKIIEALLVAGIIGNIIKTNASISGAEVGCQGEVGAACSMAAAAVAYLKGGTIDHIEYAAEIALEHHLGMTCDPVYGYVQIPCIERNAMAAQRAYDAAKYALLTDGSHSVSLDQVVETMKETGIDMMDKYKETAKGGLAKHFFSC